MVIDPIRLGAVYVRRRVPIASPGTRYVICGLVLVVALVSVMVSRPRLGLLTIGVIAVVGWIAVCLARPTAALSAIITVIVFSSHIYALAYQAGVPAGDIRILIASKDVLAWSLLIALIYRAAVNHGSVAIAPRLVAFALIVAGFFLLGRSPAGIEAQIISVRDVAIPMLALTLGAMLDRKERSRVARSGVYIISIGALLSAVQLALPAPFIRDTIGVGEYWSNVKHQALFLNPFTGLPGNFFTASGFPRLSGPFGDPLSAGEILAAALVLAVVYQDNLRIPRTQIALLAVSLLLTFTRDGWLLALLGLLAIVYCRYGVRRTIARALLTISAAVALYLAIPSVHGYVNTVLSGDDPSTEGHRLAIEKVFDFSGSTLGNGWGTGGDAARAIYSSAVSLENAYVAVAAQIGWLGLLLLLGVLVSASMQVVRTGDMRMAAFAILGALAITSFLSENTLTFNAGFIPFLAVVLVGHAPATYIGNPASTPESEASRINRRTSDSRTPSGASP